MTVTRWKSDGHLYEVGYDQNGDLENDPVVVYGKGGRMAAVRVDEDFNGMFEVQYGYSQSGELLTRFEDIGQDGYFERLQRYVEDSIITYRDTNGDGHFAEDEIVGRGER